MTLSKREIRQELNDLMDSIDDHISKDDIYGGLRDLFQQIGDPPKVVCLCGSTRFFHEFQVANFEYTMKGYIVLSVGFYAGSPDQMVAEHGEGVGITPEQKVMLDELHKRKIDAADLVYVLNVGGYIGESTRSEIDYAHSIGRRVQYLEVVQPA